MRAIELAIVLVAACGGARPAPETPPGEEHVETPPPAPAPETAPGPGAATMPAADASASQPVTQPAVEAPVGGAVFLLENAGKGDLMFSIDKGWQTVIFAYTGKPPKAKAALLFPTDCTAACDAPEEERCPVCKVEEDPRKRQAQEKAEEKREMAAPGGVVKVPWDGKVLVYEKVKGHRRCKCWRKVDPEPGAYTIKACGLRPSTVASKPTLPTCTEIEVQLPLGDDQRSLTLPFGK